jgi:rRNA processing protein Gar1
MSGRIVSRIGNQAVVEMSSREIPELGSGVFLSGRKIGRVFDVIGSVEKPLVVVGLSRGADASIIGRDVSWGALNG